jgi:hypothetical protein
MTIYVDSAYIKADVLNKETGRTVSSLWCHLISDHLDADELHQFAVHKLKLRRAYFQPGKKLGSRTEHDSAGDHYDLTLSKASQAVAHGAMLIRPEDLAAVSVLKRTVLRLEECNYALVQNKGKWFVTLEWGKEDENSPMCGAAAYGVGETIWEAVHEAVAEVSV